MKLFTTSLLAVTSFFASKKPPGRPVVAEGNWFARKAASYLEMKTSV